MRSDGSSSSGRHSFGHRTRLQATGKGELPPLPPSTPSTPKAKHDLNQGTVRQIGNGHGIARELSDEYGDDYEDQDEQEGPPPSDDDLPDTTMLDSVVLPAIASVCHLPYRDFQLAC